jgi:CBS domain containing-hemolysin-like protein
MGKIFKIDKKKEETASIFTHKGELETLFTNSTLIEDEETEYISNILNYGKTIAREIMTPLTSVISIEINSSIDELLDIVTENTYSRIPVYKDRVDNIIGYIQSTDLIFNIDETELKSLLKAPFYIPETKKVSEILMDMQRKKIPLIFVVDEYGGTSGIISAEDIAEEIVGDILLEEEEKKIKIFKNGIEVDSQVDVDDLNEEFKLDIEKTGFETIGGFVMFYLGRIPKKDENFDYKNFNYHVLDSDEKKIYKILIKNKKGKKIGKRII